RWCRWGKKDRLLCSIMFTTNKYKRRNDIGTKIEKYFPSTRLVAMDADGKNNKVLVERFSEGFEQFQDNIIDWLPDDADNVLIQLFAVSGRAVYKLNIRSGKIDLYESSKQHVGGFATDGQGKVRLASGVEDTTLRVYAREKNANGWKEIIKRQINLESENHRLDPEAVIPDTNEAYATGDYKGYTALWLVSLMGFSEPQMLFAQPGADVYTLFGPDRQLLGVGYETDKYGVKYFNSFAQRLQEAANKLLPNNINQLVSFSRDLKVAVVRSQSDHEPAFFSVLDLSNQPARFERIGSSNPALKGFDLALVEPISFPASDGTMVPGYLTRPSDIASIASTPLVVLPHGGPYARDQWGFDSWVQFLASRGYAVLQIEFRGSTGYGSDWFKEGFADWSGKPYSDVVDGTKWALSKGYGNASRTCIVGASFGGYMALLAATRNHESKLFKCAVSISGVSDLRELSKDRRWFGGWKIAQQSIGTDSDKLKADSPRTHASEINIPVMLIHGDQDYTVEVDESLLMDDALTKFNKPHELVIIKGADHYFRDDAYLRTLFTAMDGFLSKHLDTN
ncbi:MAG TPA: alpha/beta fold hydrolase, partial [Steroidobacteraceae bacterium]|nr:alpha/beta fold hydrolase [Steroidobacteraceae bacterium]